MIEIAEISLYQNKARPFLSTNDDGNIVMSITVRREVAVVVVVVVAVIATACNCTYEAFVPA